MIPLYQMKLIQIEVTNACHLQCANCTRFMGHHRKSFFMDPAMVAKGIDSLDGYEGGIGLMGGEPTLHPQFREICKIYQKMIPNRRKRELWTAGYKWDEYYDIIHETFDKDLIAYNDHSDPDEGTHQPLLVAISEVIEDKRLMWKLIDNCWVQQRWSASITPRGCFFCEVAAAQDYIFNGPGGWPIEKGWWKKTPEQFQDQMKRCCVNCSACLPIPVPNNHEPFDMMSPGNVERLKAAGSPKCLAGRYKVADIAAIRKYVGDTDGAPGKDRGSLASHPDWTPWCYRGTRWNAPGEGVLTAAEVRALQDGELSSAEAKNIVSGRISI